MFCVIGKFKINIYVHYNKWYCLTYESLMCIELKINSPLLSINNKNDVIRLWNIILIDIYRRYCLRSNQFQKHGGHTISRKNFSFVSMCAESLSSSLDQKYSSIYIPIPWFSYSFEIRLFICTKWLQLLQVNVPLAKILWMK